MASYNSPSENITVFNTLLFNQPEVQLSQAEADLLYLSKVSTDISTAGSTTFNGQLSVGGNITGSSLIQSNTTSASTNLIYNNLFSGSTLTIGTNNSTNTINGQTTFNQGLVGNVNTNTINGNGNTGTKSLYTGLTGTLNIGQPTTTLINVKGPTTFDLNTTIGTNAGSNSLSLRGEQRFYDIVSPYTSYAKISTNGAEVIYESPNIASTSHIFKIYNSSTVLITAFECNATQNISRVSLTLTNRLNFAASSPYTFPFSSNLSLGYYLKATGTGTTILSATPTTILTTASIPVGVWRIDFSVQNVVGAAGAGTITQSQSYVSTTNNGAVATAVDFTGSVIRSHTSEVYGNNDVQELTSSFTYQQSIAGVLYLNIVRSFSTGTYLFTGEVAITRIA